MAFTSLWNLLRNTVVEGILMEPLLIAVRVSVMEWQKNNALPSLKESNVGMKLKLHSFAIAIGLPSRSSLVITQSQITALSHLSTRCPIGWEFLVKVEGEWSVSTKVSSDGSVRGWEPTLVGRWYRDGGAGRNCPTGLVLSVPGVGSLMLFQRWTIRRHDDLQEYRCCMITSLGDIPWCSGISLWGLWWFPLWVSVVLGAAILGGWYDELQWSREQLCLAWQRGVGREWIW